MVGQWSGNARAMLGQCSGNARATLGQRSGCDHCGPGCSGSGAGNRLWPSCGRAGTGVCWGVAGACHVVAGGGGRPAISRVLIGPPQTADRPPQTTADHRGPPQTATDRRHSRRRTSAIDQHSRRRRRLGQTDGREDGPVRPIRSGAGRRPGYRQIQGRSRLVTGRGQTRGHVRVQSGSGDRGAVAVRSGQCTAGPSQS